MKKMVLTLLACCAFCMLAMATNSGTRPKRIEMLEQQIKDFKIERENIQHKESVLYNELSVVKKRS
jgi:septal ring factor EnvC (AmiA/AmiB activator)